MALPFFLLPCPSTATPSCRCVTSSSLGKNETHSLVLQSLIWGFLSLTRNRPQTAGTEPHECSCEPAMVFRHVPLPNKVPRVRLGAAGGVFEKPSYALQIHSLGRKPTAKQLVQHFPNKCCRRSFIYFATRSRFSATSRSTGDLQTAPSPMVFPKLGCPQPKANITPLFQGCVQTGCSCSMLSHS